MFDIHVTYDVQRFSAVQMMTGCEIGCAAAAATAAALFAKCCDQYAEVDVLLTIVVHIQSQSID